MPFDPVAAGRLPAGVRLVEARRHADKRGWFMELHRGSLVAGGGAAGDAANDALPFFCQDNVSLTAAPAAVRGLHFQRPPFAQAKLVTVLAGAIQDVIVDLRPGSREFGRVTSFHLSASADQQLFVPVGFAHGFCSLQPETIVHYKVSAPYAPAAEGGILWNDPDLGIDWPFTAAEVLVSEKDAAWPRLRDLAPIEWAA
ncbi:dTDP-4-dehydrorhamnose 3,5-epimerase [Dongia mobilis]|uniref:dTDP-4-dehydrorhamnose 3,5-epimerase n=1 Tax=Dongia mobilis TaxID=578943 RepID=A0A4R6WZU2_9PROT|nr:dTDP-4-dehydrorhamnose 3,5-epimerase [Dongia mobilis]TDQ83367.1 dTDP-4-dehydrorhamnose 3,5-epimerase [Dongia mobilis]